MKNMNILALTAGLSVAAGSAMALGNTGAAWSGLACGGDQSQVTGFRYCMANITSGTTATQLGKQTIFPNKDVYVVGGVNGSALAGLVTPTISLYLGNKIVATQSISVTTVGNVVNLGAVPYFNGLSVSVSTPGIISATNAAVISIIENDK